LLPEICKSKTTRNYGGYQYPNQNRRDSPFAHTIPSVQVLGYLGLISHYNLTLPHQNVQGAAGVSRRTAR
jgi:hypothetical protein